VLAKWNVATMLRSISMVLLHLWWFSYISRILLDHLIIQIWILDLESRIISWISVLNIHSILVHQLVTSPLSDIDINRSITVTRRRARMMCIIVRLVIAVGRQWWMVTPDWQETVFLVAEQMTIHLCSSGSVLERGGVINMRALTNLDICRVL
jgi:hypothetical protein